MQALENAGRRSWVKTYPLCPKVGADEQIIEVGVVKKQV
jgi:hypothetical protein